MVLVGGREGRGVGASEGAARERGTVEYLRACVLHKRP